MSTEVARWVSDKFYGDPTHIDGAAIGAGNGKLVAGLVFHDWHPERGTIEVSGLSERPGWLSKAMLRDVMGYVFDQLECQLLIARTSENNERVRSIFKRLGAQEYIIPRILGINEGEVIMTLTAEAWKQYGERHESA